MDEITVFQECLKEAYPEMKIDTAVGEGGVLGSGGFACVFACLDTSLNNDPRAVKVLIEQNGIKYSEREIKAQQSTGPDIAVPIYSHEYVNKNDRTYHLICMQRMDGTVRDLLRRRNGKMSLKDALTIMIAVCRDVSILHRNHMVHMDLKPENIFYRKNSFGEYQYLLGDFGGTVLEKHEQGKKGDEYSKIFYTFKYVFQASETGAERDIYALGMIMMELLGSDPGMISVPERFQYMELWKNDGNLYDPVITALCRKACHASVKERISLTEFQNGLENRYKKLTEGLGLGDHNTEDEKTWSETIDSRDDKKDSAENSEPGKKKTPVKESFSLEGFLKGIPSGKNRNKERLEKSEEINRRIRSLDSEASVYIRDGYHAKSRWEIDQDFSIRKVAEKSFREAEKKYDELIALCRKNGRGQTVREYEIKLDLLRRDWDSLFE